MNPVREFKLSKATAVAPPIIQTAGDLRLRMEVLAG
jgi:hypothetical protein